MRIVIGTALFPPDVSEVAMYIKELAERLAREHDVSIVLYGRLPEHVSNALLVSVDKRTPLPWRLVRFFFALVRQLRHADILLIENGPSVELPAAIAAFVSRKPLVIHRGDAAAHERAQRRILLRFAERFACRKARRVVTDMPLPRPEILPFEKTPISDIERYRASWDRHVHILKNVFRKII